MSDKKDYMHIKLPAERRASLEALSRRHNRLCGTRVSPTALVDAIALGELGVVEFNPAQIAAMSAAIWALRDSLQPETAKELIAILLETGKLPAAETEYLLRMQENIEVEQQAPSVKPMVDECLSSKRPFTIRYAKRNGDLKEYFLCGALIRLFPAERHRYLVATTGKSLGVTENRTFRLDQIKQVVPGRGAWVEVPWVEASIRFSGELVSRYEPRQDDLVWNPDTGILRKRVYSLWWLKREIIKYGRSATLLAPKEGIQLLVEEAQGILENYQNLD